MSTLEMTKVELVEELRSVRKQLYASQARVRDLEGGLRALRDRLSLAPVQSLVAALDGKQLRRVELDGRIGERREYRRKHVRRLGDPEWCEVTDGDGAA